MTLPSPRVIIAVVGIVLLLVLVLAIRGCSSGTTEAKLANGQGQAATQSGRDAVQTVGNQSAAEAQVDATTKENENAIRSAPGANAPVDPAARDAGLRALCGRKANRGNPKCVQFAPAR